MAMTTIVPVVGNEKRLTWRKTHKDLVNGELAGERVAERTQIFTGS